ncbi:MAG: TetR/AcrR family transcriptional regulator [Defluviitaleaceae bacterium]|nr:TetR/AcrR family transcriptional regulator [Defluviitaleaceae bacterium]
MIDNENSECERIEAEGGDYHKFLTLDEEKRGRIINASMKEFLSGYKKASTDNIVREAAISKGLLFHYFGTKEKLYDFMVRYAVETMRKEYIDLINVRQRDIFDSIWQTSLLKRDLCMKFPSVFDFLTGAYVEADHEINAGGALKDLQSMHANLVAEIFAHADLSLFRDGIDPKAAIKIIGLTFAGYANAKIAETPSGKTGETARENYDIYLEELKEILDTMRACFYKQQ